MLTFTTNKLSQFAIMHIVPETPVPDSENNSDNDGVNVILVAGVGAGALFIIAAVVFFIIRRKA